MTLILFADGFEEIEAITPLDLLRRAGIEVISAGIGKKTIQGGHSIRIETDIEISELEKTPDNIIVPGGMPGAANILASALAGKIIRDVFKNGGLVAAICAAPAIVLQPLGILNNKNATCYPGFEEHFTNAACIDEAVVKDGNIITANAAGSAIAFSLEIISYLKDKKQSEFVADKIRFASFSK